MLRLACLSALLLLSLPGAFAQPPAQAPAAQSPPQAPAAAAPAEPQAAAGPKEPVVKHTHIEDDNVAIDELRIRGQTRRIIVQPKKGGVPYEVLPLDASRDKSQEGARGAGGQSVWHFLSF
jgi:hypothetical protein